MCIGLEETNDDGTRKPLLDFNNDPFKNLKKKDGKPSSDCLRDEVRRQSGLAAFAKVPKPNGWNIAKCFNWLEKHPLSNNNDVAFLQRKAKEARQVAFNRYPIMVSRSGYHMASINSKVDVTHRKMNLRVPFLDMS
jgi:hypothetical protein